MNSNDLKRAVMIDQETKIGEWRLHKSINKGEDYYVAIDEIKELKNPDGSKIYVGYGEKKSIQEHRNRKISDILNEL